MLIFAAIVLFMAAINAWMDYMVITRGESPDHTREAIFRGIIMLVMSIIFGGSMVLILSRFVFAASIFWIAFEIILNKLRDRHWLYVGENAKTDLFFKKLFPKNTGIFMLAFKLTILIISICLTVHFGRA